jgi:DHA2 family multidrug resistance protein-like MFS transporter
MRDGMPAGLLPDAAAAALATLGGALAVAEQLGGDAGPALLDAAREAFTRSMRTAAFCAAAVLASTAVVCALVLRNVRPGSDQGGGAPDDEGAASVPAAA